MAILAVERDEGGAYAGLVLLREAGEVETPAMNAEHVGGRGSDFEEDVQEARERAAELGEPLVEEASIGEYRAEYLAVYEDADLAELGRFVARLLRDQTATIEETEDAGAGEVRRGHRLLVWEPYDEPEPVASAEIGVDLARRLAGRYGIGIRPASAATAGEEV